MYLLVTLQKCSKTSSTTFLKSHPFLLHCIVLVQLSQSLVQSGRDNPVTAVANQRPLEGGSLDCQIYTYTYTYINL